MRLHKKLALSAIVVLAALAAPAAASATTVWIAPGPTVLGNGSSCTKPGFNGIQAAIAGAPAAEVFNVCTGTYVEQIQITRALTLKAVGTPDVKMPASPQNSTTTCDTEIPNTYQRNQDLVSICTPNTVTITGIRFEALWPAGTCYDSEYGLFVGGGATLKMSSSTVAGAGNPPPDSASGCQGGVAIQLGSARIEPNEVAHGVLTSVNVSNYQKNGIDVTGVGSTGTITNATVTGSGETPFIAQNGIEVAFGGTAKIKGASISGNECNNAVCGSNPIKQTQSTGVLIFTPASGVSVTGSTINNNDIGVYYEDESSTQPSTPTATITTNHLNNDRYESVALGKGSATVSHDVISGGTVGIALLQFAEFEGVPEPYGPHGTGSFDEITGLSSYAVNGFSDKEPGDKPGSFAIKNSKISGNPPGAGVTESVHSESPSLTITTSASDT
jgi:Right handed beta helix region